MSSGSAVQSLDRPFTRSALTGALATLVDLGMVALLVGVLRQKPEVASVPALLAGALVQFLGGRHFAFRAREGSLARQAMLFTLVEIGTLALNAALYHVVAVNVPLGVTGALIARLVTTNLVFVGFSYPLWKWAFAVPRPTGRRAPG